MSTRTLLGASLALVDLGTPRGVDNTDAYRQTIESFQWTKCLAQRLVGERGGLAVSLANDSELLLSMLRDL